MHNYNLTTISEERKLLLSVLKEIGVDTYSNARSYKEMAKMFHDKDILKKEFAPGMKMLFYDSKFYMFPRILRLCWMSPYVVSHVFPIV